MNSEAVYEFLAIAESYGLMAAKRYALSLSEGTGRKLLNAIGLIKANPHLARSCSLEPAGMSSKSVASVLADRLDLYDRNKSLGSVVETLLEDGDTELAITTMLELTHG